MSQQSLNDVYEEMWIDLKKKLVEMRKDAENDPKKKELWNQFCDKARNHIEKQWDKKTLDLWNANVAVSWKPI